MRRTVVSSCHADCERMQLDVSEPAYVCHLVSTKKRKVRGKEEGEVVQDVAFDSSRVWWALDVCTLKVTFRSICFWILSMASEVMRCH